VDKGMPAGTSLNLAKTHKVATFEVTIPMLELPQGRFGMAGVEYIPFFVEPIHVQLADK
jgi:hypothetical protein